MSEINTDESTFTLIGESLCLDFANTAGWHASETPHERLTSYEKLAKWSRHAGILTEDEEKSLLTEANHRPVEADTALGQALELREAIYRLFVSVIQEQSITHSDDLAILNKYVKEAYQYAEILPKTNGFSLEFQKNADKLNWMLWPIVQSTTDLLVSGKLDRVKQCEGDPCGWLFLDTSRNRSRRWCSMQDCGNRAKARRFYQRKK
ncbi:MAG TPA: CGNR zinc finger domain-containing protein [Bacillales bacterium]|nr:CGNR zinc finger domain-containing protein [Bacillales bacterium]